jgi:hypothetical protein
MEPRRDCAVSDRTCSHATLNICLDTHVPWMAPP